VTSHVTDSLGRRLRDLRISVTDRCNFRCIYCMPREVYGSRHPFLPRAELLTFEEITQAAAAFLRAGGEKLRLTGGEPLLRRDLDCLVRMLRALPGLRELALTTNGAFLEEHAVRLKLAGLDRITVSVDSVNPATFAAMNDVAFPLDRVLRGIAAARNAGFNSIKINAVIKRGLNEDDILPLTEYFQGEGFILRFIEYMDVGETNGWQMRDVVPASEILSRLQTRFDLEPLPPNYQGEVARRFRHTGPAGGEIGLITSVTQPFCGHCTRARLSADGRLHTCLFSGLGHDLRSHLRNGASAEQLDAVLAMIWSSRSDRYSELRFSSEPIPPKPEMSRLGG
jgi:cyclic pyranopterin phosphate synthase